MEKDSQRSQEGSAWVRRVPLPLWIFLCGCLWGSAFPMIKLAYAHWAGLGITMDFGTRSLFAGVRFVIAGAALLMVARNPWGELCRTPAKWLLVMGLTQTVGQYVCFYLGLNLAGGALASLLVTSGSFWWVLIAPWMLKTPALTLRQWLVLCVGAAGLSLAVYAPGVPGESPRIGGLLVILSNLFGALGVVAYQFVGRTMGPKAGTGFSLGGGGVVLALLGFSAWGSFSSLFDGYIWMITLWLAFVSASAFALWNHLSTLFPVHLLATYRFMIPLCGLAESLMLIRGEKVTPLMMLGGAVVIGAMIVAQREIRGREATKSGTNYGK